MSTLAVRWVFAALCGVFFISIAGVAGWEWIRFKRRESALSPRHFRWRLLSALTWLIVLGSFFVATVFLWPQSRLDTIMARRFLLVSSSALVLMVFAFVLMAVDIFWTIQVGRQATLKRSRAAQETLQRQLERSVKPEGGPMAPLETSTNHGDDQQRDDEAWMREALAWSLRGKGWTSPRPSVGCVLVRDGRIIGGGHTQKGNGQPHAEVVALRDAQKNSGGARGATAYVTLEPCSHFATTPPCSDALIENGIARVVAGVVDPNPAVAGNGFRKLREAGVEVVQGVLEADCARAMDEFLFSIVRRTPFVCLKSAVSLDGKIALPNGESKWITGPQSRRYAHQLRHFADAILVGIETVLTDDPSLSVRLDEPATHPIRIVLDSHARLPLDAKIWQDAPALIVAVGPEAPSQRIQELQSQGATIIQCQRDTNGHLAWRPLLEELGSRSIISLLIEGGARVAGSALQAGVVDKIAWFVAPMLMGEGKSALSGFEVEHLTAAPRLSLVESRVFGQDVLLEGYLKPIPGMNSTAMSPTAS